MSKEKRDNYTRVTNILYPFSGLEKIDPVILSNAANRGTKVHKICEAIINGLGEIGVDDETRPYIESFKQWWELGHKVLMVEHRFWCDDIQVTGQVDLVIETSEGLAIVDFKTSSAPSKTWPAQGSAYAYLAKKSGVDIKKIYFLHLLKNGKPAKIYEYPIDDNFFLNILKIWNHFFNANFKIPKKERKFEGDNSKVRHIHGDWGDDIKDFEKKQNKTWRKEVDNNPIYRGFR